MNYRYIAVEGNIGSGKSSLATLLAEHFGSTLVLEEFADNPFLPKFYKEPERHAFPLELAFLADRFKQLKQVLLNTDMFQGTVISDYLFIKSKLFAKVNLKEDEYELFQKFFDILNNSLPRPDLVIYLHSPVQKLQQNIKSRGRNFEQNISDDYLRNVQETYQQYLKQNAHKTIIIDTTNVDFVSNNSHLEQIISFLGKDYNFSTHYLTID